MARKRHHDADVAEEDQGWTADQEYADKEAHLKDDIEKLKAQREHEQELREKASEEYETKTEEAKKAAEERGEVEPEPPPEAASHEGVGTYKLKRDVTIRHKDYKAGDTVYLTSEEYQTLRGLGVHCEAVEQQQHT